MSASASGSPGLKRRGRPRKRPLTREEFLADPKHNWRLWPWTFAEALSKIDCIGCQQDPPDPNRINHSHWEIAPHIIAFGVPIVASIVQADGKDPSEFIRQYYGNIWPTGFPAGMDHWPPRLAIEMPPRHGKSEFISKWLPAWYLSQAPNRRVMLGTYEADFAASWGGKVRDIIQRNRGNVGIDVNPSTTARDYWETNAGGGMATAGVGGPFTGKGAHLLVLDDLIKNSQEAQSQVVRESVWNWLVSSALTRMEPGGVVVLLMTRWHEDDPIGRIRTKMASGEMPPWTIINFPAIAEQRDILGRQPGDALWPVRYDVKALDQIKRTVGSWVWSALYQQKPVRAEGNFFKRAWFEIVSPGQVPTFKRVVRFWDLAGTVEGEKGNSDPDYTVGVKMGLSEANVAYVLDVKRVRETPARVEKLVQTTAAEDGIEVSIEIEQDPGQAAKDQIWRYTHEVLLGYDARGRKTDRKAKTTRARPANAACERAELKLVRAAWNEAYLDEMCAFPTGGHDDQVDATSGAYQMLTLKRAGWDLETVRNNLSPEAGKIRTGTAGLPPFLQAAAVQNERLMNSFGGRLRRMARARR